MLGISDVKAEDLPVLALPFPICELMSRGDWHTAVVLARWHRHLRWWSSRQARLTRQSVCPGPMPGWPSASSAVWANQGAHGADWHSQSADLSSGSLGAVASDLRRWAPKILDGLTPEERAKEESSLTEDIGRLMAWRSSLQDSAGGQLRRLEIFNESQRLRHKSARLVECIRFSRCVVGGSSNLEQAIKRGLALALPPSMSKGFIESFEDSGSLPSASLIRHAEFSLDVAMLLWQRERSTRDVVRYMWSDSSPMLGYDWLWSQYHEIERTKLVTVAQAVWSFEQAFREHVAHLIQALDHDTTGNTIDHRELERRPEWAGWLDLIALNITEHINPPAALGQGFRDVQDKLKAIVFK